MQASTKTRTTFTHARTHARMHARTHARMQAPHRHQASPMANWQDQGIFSPPQFVPWGPNPPHPHTSSCTVPPIHAHQQQLMHQQQQHQQQHQLMQQQQHQQQHQQRQLQRQLSGNKRMHNQLQQQQPVWQAPTLWQPPAAPRQARTSRVAVPPPAMPPPTRVQLPQPALSPGASAAGRAPSRISFSEDSQQACLPEGLGWALAREGSTREPLYKWVPLLLQVPLPVRRACKCVGAVCSPIRRSPTQPDSRRALTRSIVATVQELSPDAGVCLWRG